MAMLRDFAAKRMPFALLAVLAAATIAACAEDYEGGGACPALCPEQNVVVFDTVFDPVELDTSLVGSRRTERKRSCCWRGLAIQSTQGPSFASTRCRSITTRARRRAIRSSK